MSTIPESLRSGRLRGIAAIDTLIGFRAPADVDRNPTNVRSSQRGVEHPADYMYRDIPSTAAATDDEQTVIADTLAAMDRHGVAVGLVSLGHPAAEVAAARHPDRFALELQIDGDDVLGSLRRIRDRTAGSGPSLRAVGMFPAGTSPPRPLDTAHWYPVYTTCVELGLPLFVTVGVPGPRVPMAGQHVEAIDRVMYDFPDLVMVLRHGGEPWVDLAVKLMLKWPGLHYSTSAFAPKHYPRAIIDYANRRGADRIVYAGYHPYALELDRIFAELDDVPFRPHVWAPFLRDNAARLLGLVD